MKPFEIKQRIAEHLCSNYPSKQDGKNKSTTVTAISNELSIEWNLVNLYIQEMKSRGFVETDDVTSYVGYEYKVRTKTLLFGFLQEGGYIEENRIKSLSEQLADSTLETNKVQRISLILTIIIIFVGCVFQGIQLCISNRDYKLHKQQMRQDSPTIDDLKAKLNAIRIELDKNKSKEIAPNNPPRDSNTRYGQPSLR
jgi:hypothetical protein